MTTHQINKPIGIYGGTFDPIHYGHLRPALEIAEKFQLAHIRFIPSATPPHRERPEVSSQWRLKLTQQAITDCSRFILDDRELKRLGQSYMIDTLISLHEEFPKTPLCLILGLDAFLNFHLWHRYNEILDYCHIIVTLRPENNSSAKIITNQKPRPDANVKENSFSFTDWPKPLRQLFKSSLDSPERIIQKQITMLQESLCGKLVLADVTQLAISASDIRQRIKNNLSIQYLVPDIVDKLITQNKLYQQKL